MAMDRQKVIADLRPAGNGDPLQDQQASEQQVADDPGGKKCGQHRRHLNAEPILNKVPQPKRASKVSSLAAQI